MRISMFLHINIGAIKINAISTMFRQTLLCLFDMILVDDGNVIAFGDDATAQCPSIVIARNQEEG